MEGYSFAKNSLPHPQRLSFDAASAIEHTNGSGVAALAIEIAPEHGMCGRYRLSRRKQLVEEYFESAPWDEEWIRHYNIAPTQQVPVIRQHPKEPLRQLSLVKRGLIPHWAKDPSIAASTINAKSETAAHEASLP